MGLAIASGFVSAVVAAAGALPVRPAEAGEALGVVDRLKTLAAQLAEEAEGVVAALKAYDFASLKERVDAAAVVARDMQDAVSGWVWGAAEFIPVYGEDVAQARLLIDMLVEVMDVALVPAADALASTSFDELVARAPRGVSIDGEILGSLVRIAEEAVPILQRDVEQVEGFADFHVAELQEAFDEARGALGSAKRWLDLAGRALPAVMTLSGCDGAARSYLVVVQDNRRVLSTGGWPGAAGVLTAQDGSIAFHGFSDPRAFLPAPAGAAEGFTGDFTDEELRLFGRIVAEDPCAAGRIPHFPRAAGVWRRAASEASGVAFDAAVAVDPAFVDHVLELCGSTWDPNGTSYEAADGTAGGCEGFVEAANDSFDALFDRIVTCGFSELVDVVWRDAVGRRFNMWSSLDDEQGLFEELGCAGSLTDAAAGSKVGFFLSGGGGSTSARWLEAEAETGSPRSRGTGETVVPVTFVVSNAVPEGSVSEEEEAAAFVDPEVGSDAADGDFAAEGDAAALSPSLTLFAYAPLGSAFSSFTAGRPTMSRRAPWVTHATHMGRDVRVCEFRLLPGESIEFSCAAAVPSSAEDEAPVSLSFDTTPLSPQA